MRNGNAAQTKSAVADAASQVDVPFAMSCVIVFTDAVFLHTRTVIDAVQQMGVAQQVQRTEQRTTVNRGQPPLQVGQTKGIGETVTYLMPNKQAYRCDAYACML